MPVFTIETPRGRQVDVEADDQATAIRGAQRYDLEDYASGAAQKYGVSPDLVIRQMNVESGANPTAKSPKGALGPMQLMPGTAKGLGVDPSDPYQNIDGGVRYLKQQLDAFGGDEAKALAAYNAGPGAVRRAGGVPNYPETRKYVAAIANRPQAAPVAPSQPATAQAAPKKDQGLGFVQGMLQPLSRINAINPVAMLDPRLGQLEQGAQDWVKSKLAGGSVPGMIGQIGGNIVGTLPTALIPGGPLVQGAASGALLTKAKDAKGVAVDMALGAAGAKLGDMAFKGVVGAASKALRPKTPGVDALAAAKNAAYDAAEAAGVRFNPNTFNGLITATGQDLAAENLNPLLHPNVVGVLDEMAKMRGQSPSLTEMDQLRRFVRMNAIDGAKPDEQRLGKIILGNIDDFINSARAPQVVAGDPAAGAAAISTARDMNTRLMKTRAVNEAVDQAGLRASATGSGGNVDNATRQNVLRVLKKTYNFTPEEEAAAQKAIAGTPVQNLLRLLGRMSPTNGAIPALTMGIGGLVNPVAAAPGMVGLAAKGAADTMTRGNVGDLLSIIANGGKPIATPIASAVARRAGPVIAAAGAAGATQAAAAARKPTLRPWPKGAVMQDASGNFYDAKGRPVS